MDLQIIENLDYKKQDGDDASTSSIELPSKEKPKKERKPFVMTDARKQAFEKARAKRDENRALRKIQKEEQKIIAKKEVEEKIIQKADIIHKKKQKEMKILDEISSDSEPEVIIQRVKKPKKKVIVVESDSEDEIVIQKRGIKKDHPPKEIIKKMVPIFV
jgi:preprotein translocase subunit SecD